MRPFVELKGKISCYGNFAAAPPDPDSGFAAALRHRGADLRVIASWGEDWDHVSVSLVDRCPTWDEMCWIKNLFFKDEEWAIQYHPAKSKYINDHPYVLHLWRPQRIAIPTPPLVLV